MTSVPGPFAPALDNAVVGEVASERALERAEVRACSAVFEVSDGPVSSVSLTLGAAGAHSSPTVVRLTGLAALVFGAWSMARGESLSSRAHVELLRRELDVERGAQVRQPDAGSAENAEPEIVLMVHDREEFGFDPAPHTSVAPLASVALGAAAPLVVWSFAGGTTGSELVAAVALVVSVELGFALGRPTGRVPVRFVAPKCCSPRQPRA